MRPGTVRLFESLKPVAMSLLFGTVPAHIRHNLLNDANGLLRQGAINVAHGEDQQALALQHAWNDWELMNTKYAANKMKTKFLMSLQSNG